MPLTAVLINQKNYCSLDRAWKAFTVPRCYAQAHDAKILFRRFMAWSIQSEEWNAS